MVGSFRARNVKVDSLNGYVVLTGTVQNPIDATRAAEIAKAFVDKGLSAGSSVIVVNLKQHC